MALPATAALLDALVDDPDAFVAALGSPVPPGWPQFPEAIPAERARLAASPDEVGWGMHFFLDAGTLVGSGGFTGPPRSRTVEIGYEVAPAFRGRGLGTASAAALLGRALESGQVDVVEAHTLATTNPSTRVLHRLGFRRVAEVPDEEHGTLWRWQRRRLSGCASPRGVGATGAGSAAL